MSRRPSDKKSKAMDSKREKISAQNLPLDCWCHVIMFLSTRSDYVSLLLTIRGLLNHVRCINPYCAENVPFRLFHLPKISCREVSNLAVDNRTSKIPKELEDSEIHPREEIRTFLSRFGEVNNFIDILNAISGRFPELRVLSFDIQLQLIPVRRSLDYGNFSGTDFNGTEEDLKRWTFKHVNFHNNISISPFICLQRLHIRIFCDQISFCTTNGSFFPLLEHLSLERPPSYQSVFFSNPYRTYKQSEFVSKYIGTERAELLDDYEARGKLMLEWSCFPRINELILKGWKLQFSLNSVPSGKLKGVRLENTEVLPEDANLKIQVLSFVLVSEIEEKSWQDFAIEDTRISLGLSTVKSLEQLVLQSFTTKGAFVNSFDPGKEYLNLKQIYLHSITYIHPEGSCDLSFSHFQSLEKIYIYDFQFRRSSGLIYYFQGEAERFVYFRCIPKLKDIRMNRTSMALECQDDEKKMNNNLEIIHTESKLGENIVKSLSNRNELQNLKILALPLIRSPGLLRSISAGSGKISVINKPRLERMVCTNNFFVSSIEDCRSLKTLTCSLFGDNNISLSNLDSLEVIYFQFPLPTLQVQRSKVEPSKLENILRSVFRSIRNCGSRSLKKVVVNVLPSSYKAGFFREVEEMSANHQSLDLKGSGLPEVKDLVSFEGDRMCFRLIKSITIDGENCFCPQKVLLRMGNAEIRIKNIGSHEVVCHPDIDNLLYGKIVENVFSPCFEVHDCPELEILRIESVVEDYKTGEGFTGRMMQSRRKIDPKLLKLKISLSNLPNLINLGIGCLDCMRTSSFECSDLPNLRRLSIGLESSRSIKSLFGDIGDSSLTISGREFPLLEELVMKILADDEYLYSNSNLYKLECLSNLPRLKFVFVQKSTKYEVVERTEGIDLEAVLVGTGKELPSLRQPIRRVDLENVMTLKDYMNQFVYF